MRSVIPIISFLAFIGLVVSSCVKYDDGGQIRKAEDNLTRDWKMTVAEKNGLAVDSVAKNPQIGRTVGKKWVFHKDGTMKTSDTGITMQGFWNFEEDRRKLKIEISSPASRSSVHTYTIKKLTEGEDRQMYWEHNIDGDDYWYEFEAP